MTKDLHAIRGIDDGTYRKFRERALVERMKVGRALNLAMKDWVKKEDEKKIINPKNLLKIKPIKIGRKQVRWSEQIDETLYGSRK